MPRQRRMRRLAWSVVQQRSIVGAAANIHEPQRRAVWDRSAWQAPTSSCG